MSLSDDSREIADSDLRTMTIPNGDRVCVFCGRGTCRSFCVRRSLPKIVAVIEAATEWVALIEAPKTDDKAVDAIRSERLLHVEQRIIDAVKGE